MKVYRLRNDVNRYQYFLPANIEDDKAGVFLGDCRPRAAMWRPPPVFILEPFHEAGDFYQFDRGALITSPRATVALYQHLVRAGELLPLFHEGREYTWLNITECINCLDQEHSEWLLTSEGARIYPIKYVFHRDRFTGCERLSGRRAGVPA